MRARWMSFAVTVILVVGCGGSAKPARYAASVVLLDTQPAPDFVRHDDRGRAVRRRIVRRMVGPQTVAAVLAALPR
jgi:hypothetical protein